MFTLSKEKFEITYTNRLFSVATCVYIIIYFGIIVIPFVLVFASENFWIMISNREEQLDIQYKGIHFVQIITNDDKIYHFTNSKYYPTLLAENAQNTKIFLFDKNVALSGSSISVLLDDQNADNIPEQLDFKFTLQIDADKVKQITILLPISCYFESLHFQFDSYLYFQESEIIVNKGLSQLQMIGDINFYQQEPIPSSNFDVTQYSRVQIDDQYWWLSEFLNQIFTHQYQIRPNYQVRKIGGNQQKQLKVHIQLDNKKLQQIQRWVSLLATIKLGWLQYFSVFILIWIIGREFLIFLYRFRIIETSKVDQL